MSCSPAPKRHPGLGNTAPASALWPEKATGAGARAPAPVLRCGGYGFFPPKETRPLVAIFVAQLLKHVPSSPPAGSCFALNWSYRHSHTPQRWATRRFEARESVSSEKLTRRPLCVLLCDAVVRPPVIDRVVTISRPTGNMQLLVSDSCLTVCRGSVVHSRP